MLFIGMFSILRSAHMAHSHLIAYCKHCHGLGQRGKAYIHMHVHTYNDLIHTSSGRLSYIFIVKVLEEMDCYFQTSFLIPK